MLNIDKRLSMRKLQTNKKRLAPLIVCSLLVSSLGSITNNAEASTIVDGNGNTLKPNFQTGAYEIRPDIFNGDVGFKKFQEMNLSKGDIMNFIFQAYNMKELENGDVDINSWDIDTFVNLVRDQIQLNGIVNAVKSFEGGLKNDGNLIFISPQGMVVGASGVLNVGSLHTYTPSVESFNSLYDRMPSLDPGKNSSGQDYTYSIDAEKTNLSLSDIETLKGSEGAISINGRILARGDVGLNGSDVNVGGTGIILAGVNDNTAFNKQNLGADKDESTIRVTADALFTQLVNAGDTNSANSFSANNGKIVITSTNGTDIASRAIVRNNAAYDGGITITNTGTNGVKINGEVSNVTGNLTVDNQAGALNVGDEGLVRNNGTMDLNNHVSGTGVSIAGTVENDGTLKITNDSGNDGLSISGSVTNDTGAATIHNQLGGLDVSGSVTSNGTKLAMTNDGDEGFTIANGGSVTSTNGDADLINNENMFDINGTVTSSGDTLDITNNGVNGLNIAGDVLNKNGIGNIQNTQGGLNVEEGGLVQNDGTSIAMTNSGDGGFTVAGDINNNAGTAELLNNDGLFDIQNGGTVYNKGTSIDITNSATGDGLTIAGTVYNSNGTASMTNEAGKFLVSGTGNVIGDGSSQKITMTNTGSGFTMAGTVDNINELEMSNAGSNGFDISGTVTNDGNADISNTAGLLNISGTVTNTGNLDIYNHDTGTGFDISGTVSNSGGIANLTNDAGAFDILAGGEVNSNGTELNITNNGADDLNIAGTVNNNTGAGKITNNAGSTNGGLNISGTVYNNGSSIGIDNYGSKGLNISGRVDSDNGNTSINNYKAGLNVQAGGRVENDGDMLAMNNSGDAGFTVNGLIDNNKGDATLSNNSAGDFDILYDGEVNNGQNAGTLTMTNSGTGALHVQSGGTVLNDGDELAMTNNGSGGFIIDGLVDNNKGDATLSNNSAGNFDINEGGIVDNGKSAGTLTMNNSGTGALNVNAGGTVLNDGDELNMTNNGAGGFLIDGNVFNTNGDAELNNTNNMFDINGTVTNSGDSLAIANSGAGGLGISGTVTNQNGTASITNTNGSLYIDGQIIGEENSQSMTIVNKENGTGLTIDADGSVNNINKLTISNESGTNGLNIEGTVTNNGDADIKNTAAGGLNVKGSGSVSNSTGYLHMTNTQGGLNVEPDANINSSGSEIVMTNSGNSGMNIQGHVTNTNNAAKVEFNNSNSNMVIGHETTDENIQSNADILIAIQNGNLLNYFADKNIDINDAEAYKNATKTLIKTTDVADLTINATNSQIGTDLGLCDGGVCTGIGPNERNLTKSINTSIDGTITADSTGENALVNMASLDTDMRVNKIHAENGKVILLADDKYDKGANRYDIVNRAEDETVPNLKGDSISAIASGNIGAKDNKVTFIQTNAHVDIANENDDASKPHELYDEPIVESKGGVEFLAQGDINIKGLDNADGTKNDTNVCTIASREGSVNAEFSGNTYIRDITAQDEVNIVNRGPEIYIENLGGAPSRYAETGDYYGMYDGIVPERANITALDLGTPDDPHTFENGHYPNSTIVIKNGTINGKGSVSHPGMDQDITVTADNAYVGGYYFNMGKHRYNDPENPDGLSQVTKDPYTNTITNAGDPDTPVSIRGKAVRPDDVEDIGQDTGLRDYYYWDQDGDGDPSNNDPDPDGSGQKDNDDFEEPFDPDVEGGDDLVVPEPEPVEPPPGDDDDDEPDPPPPGDDDDDEPDPPPPGDDDDDEPDPPPPGDDDDDEPDPPPPGDDDDDEPDPPPPGDDDDDDITPDEPPAVMDDAKRTWKKEIDDNISVIDKRQYIRFDIEGNPNPVIFESVPEVSGILNISRGGVQLSHNKTLKVGDIVPVHLKYGDVDIQANVKIVSANDETAGGEFVDLDLATANQLLYLSLLMDGNGNIEQQQYYAQTEDGAISTTGEDE